MTEEADATRETERGDGLDEILREAIEGQSKDDDEGETAPETTEDRAEEAEDGEADGEGDAGAEGEGDGDEGGEEKPAIEIPSDFPADKREALGRLPVDAQKFVLQEWKDMRGDYTRKTQEVAEHRKRIEPLLGVVERFKPYFQALGIPPEQSFSTLVQADAYLRNPNIPMDQKVNFVRNFTRDYGIDLAPPQSEGTPEYVDPQIAAIKQEFSREIGAMREKERQRELREQAEYGARLTGEIERFQSDTEADGKPKHPHFDRVKPAMAALLKGGAAVDLSDAYDKAVRMDPELFNQVLEAERKRVSEAEEARRQEAVDKAKKAKTKGSDKPAPRGDVRDKDLDSILKAEIRKHYS